MRALDPGFSDSDIVDLLKDQRFRTAVHAYAHDKLTLGEAVFIAANRAVRGSWVPPRFDLNISTYLRLFHEVAKRIRAKTIVIDENELADVEAAKPQDLPELFTWGVREFKFSKLEELPQDMHPLRVLSDSFDETDIAELIRDPRVLAGIDAYTQGFGTLGDMRQRVFGDEDHVPRSLSHEAFWNLIVEIKKADRRRRHSAAAGPTRRPSVDLCAFARSQCGSKAVS
jgi:hypothetical protein